ncbi:MAG: iron-sulfur cluster assembly scaffold protein [Chloroflexota bacterium]|nr:iron-sulfur cluster assembly scaffold protein [Chloroflexota bacterium]
MNATSMDNQKANKAILKSAKEKLDSPALSRYAPAAQEIIITRENMGKLEKPDLFGSVRGCCGDSIQIELRLEGDVIQDARFQTDGCSATIACGGMITRMILGKTLAQALKLEPDALRKALGGLPSGHQHCANLTVNTLRTIILKGTSEDTLEDLIGPFTQEKNL